MSAKYTPGPWEYDRETGEILCPAAKADGGRNFVGRFHAGREDAGQDARPRMADGVLMAAAPEMLEALKAAELELDRYASIRPEAAVTLVRVRKAIARSES